MIASAPLIIGPDQIAVLRHLVKLAEETPVDVVQLQYVLDQSDKLNAHRAQMASQTVILPGLWDFRVTFSFETGHPGGDARHMSMSIDRPGRVPHPEAVWIVAKELGFTGSLENCLTWPEELQDGDKAINVVQLLDDATQKNPDAASDGALSLASQPISPFPRGGRKH